MFINETLSGNFASPYAATLNGTSVVPFAPLSCPPAGSPYTAALQPIFYWYPSPPVSPQSAYYLPPCPAAITVKGLPPATQAGDILAFLEGLYDVGYLVLKIYFLCFLLTR